MNPEIKLSWKGEKIKQEIKTPESNKEHEFTPKQLIDSLDQERNQLQQAEQQYAQIETNLKNTELNIQNSKAAIKKMEEFEEKCIEIQMDKLKHYINQIKAECKEKAEEAANKVISQSPHALTEEQKKVMPYINYQRLLATNKKIAEGISPRIIKKHLFEVPVFENPFK